MNRTRLEIAEDTIKELDQELKTAIINKGTDVEMSPTKSILYLDEHRIRRKCRIKVTVKNLSQY